MPTLKRLGALSLSLVLALTAFTGCGAKGGSSSSSSDGSSSQVQAMDLSSVTDPFLSTAGLSGGERQRISIARALLKDAPIVLLDEATASLDVENETKVQGALSRLLTGKTVLVIAHRMRTVAGADHIVVLKDGRVEQQGSPQELMAEGGLFRHMVELQTESAQWQLSGARP